MYKKTSHLDGQIYVIMRQHDDPTLQRTSSKSTNDPSGIVIQIFEHKYKKMYFHPYLFLLQDVSLYLTRSTGSTWAFDLCFGVTIPPTELGTG